jgi:hypothetical protein
VPRSTRVTKARILWLVHRHTVGALLGIAWAAYASLWPKPAAAHDARLETGYVQYGAALTAELLASPGAICPSDATVPCVIGSGGGLAVRAGYRFHAPFYLGGAYEFSKQDAHKSISVAILQQLRAEARYLFPVSGPYIPFIAGGGGAVGYGSEWTLQTVGATVFLGMGLEVELSRTSVMVFVLSYRPILLTTWRDSALQERPTGVLSMVGLEIGLEQRNPVYSPPDR